MPRANNERVKISIKKQAGEIRPVFLDVRILTICSLRSNLCSIPVYRREAGTVLLSVCHIARRSRDTSGEGLGLP